MTKIYHPIPLRYEPGGIHTYWVYVLNHPIGKTIKEDRGWVFYSTLGPLPLNARRLSDPQRTREGSVLDGLSFLFELLTPPHSTEDYS